MECHPKPIEELHHFSRWFSNHQPAGILVLYIQHVYTMHLILPWINRIQLMTCVGIGFHGKFHPFFWLRSIFQRCSIIGIYSNWTWGYWPRNSGFLEISGEFTPVDLDGKLCWPRPVGPVALRLSFRLKAGQFLQFRCKNRFLGDLLLQCWDPLKYRMNIFPMVDIKSTILSKEV